MSKVRRQAEDDLEDAKLRATSNVLFADEKRLREEVDRISDPKATFVDKGDTPFPNGEPADTNVSIGGFVGF